MDLTRTLPLLVLVPLGALLMQRGIAHFRDRWRLSRGPDRALVYVYAFRHFALGACLIAAAVGRATDASWLVAAAACIGIGEVLECSYYIAVMRWGAARLRAPSAAEPLAEASC
jgi:hypothetical protein